MAEAPAFGRVEPIREDARLARASGLGRGEREGCCEDDVGHERPSLRRRRADDGTVAQRRADGNRLSGACNMQLMYVAAMATAELRSLARDLSRSWHELGGILTSRRMQASLHGGPG